MEEKLGDGHNVEGKWEGIAAAFGLEINFIGKQLENMKLTFFKDFFNSWTTTQFLFGG